MTRISWILLLVAQATLGCAAVAGTSRVRPGIEVLLTDSLSVVTGHRLGLITNQTGIDALGNSSIELLNSHPKLRLQHLFSPEHGLDGSRPAGELVQNAVHPATNLPVTSLYQGSTKVNPELLKGLDQVLFDVQDIGIRPYTYTSTLGEVMKAAKVANVEVVVLDRPNPLGGILVSGLTLESEWASFIGPYPIPYVHGLSVGEWARMVNEAFGIACRLRVIPMSGWRRSMSFAETGLPWIPTSPNVPSWDTPLAMSMTGAVGELGVASIGIGTTSPFWVIGTPAMDAAAVAESLNASDLPGCRAIPWHWTPTSGSWSGKMCHGVRLLVIDHAKVDPGCVQLTVMQALRNQLGDSLLCGTEAQLRMFNKAMGTDRVQKALRAGESLGGLRKQMQADRKDFILFRRPYLLYPD